MSSVEEYNLNGMEADVFPGFKRSQVHSSAEPPWSSNILQTHIQVKDRDYCLSMVKFTYSNGVHCSLMLLIAYPVQADVCICCGQSIPELAYFRH